MKMLQEWQNKNDHQTKILKILTRCKALLYSIIPDAELILYGSFARGEVDDDSDIDLIVLVNRPVDWTLIDTIRNAVYEISIEANMVISVIVREKRLWRSPHYCVLPLYQNIEQEGVIVK